VYWGPWPQALRAAAQPRLSEVKACCGYCVPLEPAIILRMKTDNDQVRATMQVSWLLDIYKHHHEIAIRTVTVYFAAVGVLVGYVFRTDVAAGVRAGLLILVLLASSLLVFACHRTRTWLKNMDGALETLSEQLRLVPAPILSQGSSSILITEVAAWIVAASAAAAIFIFD
jgi:hypothetical protein